jgi:hypothetical protein
LAAATSAAQFDCIYFEHHFSYCKEMIMIEILEPRRMFTVTPDPGQDFATAFNVGDLRGAVTLGDAVGATDTTDYYKFTMPQDGMFFGRLRAFNAPAEIDLVQEQIDPITGEVHEVLLDFRNANQDGPDGGFASGDLPGEFLTAGNYFMIVTALSGQDTSYLIRMTSDFGGDALATATNIGSLTDQSFRDFIGQFPTPSLEDPFDTYKFKMDATGAFTADFALDSTDPNTFQAHIALIQDVNGNNAIDPGDLLVATDPGVTGHISGFLSAGSYFLRVISDLNFSNYSLHLNADYANTDHLRDMGSLDKQKSFNDFIGVEADPIDAYKFTLNSRRPFFAAFSEGGDDTSNQSRMVLYRDSNHDGVGEPDEIFQVSGTGRFESILRPLDPGDYILQVEAQTGAATYTLTAEARPDQAGNSLGTAKNLGAVKGLIHLDDYLTVNSDPVDFYKFTMSAAGTIGAAIFPEFAGDANLSLIRDTNNNGVVDANEVLASASLTSSGAKEFTKALTAGTYFLRVTQPISSSATHYFLTFHTDFAGGSVPTARNVGTLSGTVGFDDWASGPFTGAISDRNDLYKLTLAAAKKFTAKLTGTLSGEDLKLILYRDKNNDGKLTDDEIITLSDVVNSPNELITRQLAAGTYYVRVWGVNGETNYHLALTAS